MAPPAPPRPPRIKAILMDQFGTLTDQHGSMTRLLAAQAAQCGVSSDKLGAVDWSVFAERWRAGYLRRTREIASGAEGPGDIDELHLELLDELLQIEEYKAVADAWDAGKRKEICQFWHRLDAWPDTKPALEAIRQLDPPVLLATLSNGTLRLLIDVARHNNLPIDAHFSGNLLQSYKPNPVMYCRASELLGFDAAARERGEVAMFASHVDDLVAAKQQGLYAIYIRRSTEDTGKRDGVKTFSEGGQVDVIIDDMSELVDLLK
ncbi:hypothetical protein JCM10908_005642 [Rhodotorula pacifica]|uniref:uncharacterized protein n=1 Tax=Rhodotorula pacifica TaxID=1495444 RepID=UPI0031768C32